MARWRLKGLFAMSKLKSVKFRCLVSNLEMKQLGLTAANQFVANTVTVLKHGSGNKPVRVYVQDVLLSHILH
jgi:hypothetical protein